ncbi:MAG: hypothetical protein Kow0062_12890 [Acidobacteriota bacterium]
MLGVCAPAAAGTHARQAVRVEPPYQRLIERVAARHRIDPKLFAALVEVESGRRADAVSHAGARGLAQLMPATAARFRVSDPHDPEENLEGAARYLRWLLSRYRGDLRLALAAYNAGEGAVDRAGGVPRFRETRAFVRRVLARAGYDERGRPKPPEPEPVRIIRRGDGSLLITNLP